MNFKEDIKFFLNQLKDKYKKPLPTFAHNLKKESNKVYYSGFYWDDNEVVAFLDAFLSNSWSVNGKICVEFEREFSKRTNNKDSVMVSSGSSANLILLTAAKDYLKWGDDSEIIVSACSFPTSVSVIYQARLKPIFCDISWNNLNINLDEVERKITNKTKAILIAPTLGSPPDFDKLLEIKNKYNIKILLDNCDSLGTTWRGKQLTEYVFASSCSFFASHHLGCIQSGMVSSNNVQFIDNARAFATWSRDCFCRGEQNLLKDGMCKSRFKPWIEELPDVVLDHKYYFTKMGYNLQGIDVFAALGLEQLKKSDEIHHKRKQNKNKITELLQKYIKDIYFPETYKEADISWFGVPCVTKTHELKKRLVNYLEGNGIQTRNFFSGNILLHPGYKFLGNWKEFPNSTDVLRYVFFLGCSPTITEGNINYIEQVLSKFPNE